MIKTGIQVGLLLGLFVGVNAYGQPSPAIKFIMNQPLSILDFGLYRMTEDLDDWVSFQRFDLPNNTRFEYQIFYHEGSNNIRLQLDAVLPHNYLYEITVKEKACSRVITSLRRYFYTIGISKGAKAISNKERSMKGIYKYFRFKGANESGRPDNAMHEIELSTVIRVTLVPGSQIDEAFKCSAPLMGEDIQFFDTAGPFID